MEHNLKGRLHTYSSCVLWTRGRTRTHRYASEPSARGVFATLIPFPFSTWRSTHITNDNPCHAARTVAGVHERTHTHTHTHTSESQRTRERLPHCNYVMTCAASATIRTETGNKKRREREHAAQSVFFQQNIC